MLNLIFKSFIDGEYIYDYYPEGKEAFGTVSYNVNTDEVNFVKIAPSDEKLRRYAMHAVQALLDFAENGEFPKERLVA